MEIIGLNGSPRGGWNTAQMVKAALEGAANAGAATRYYDLYKMDYRGCSSCFECLRLGGPSYGKCAMRDSLTPILEAILAADGVIIGSPVYFGDVTACVRALLERLWFAGLAYSFPRMSLYEKRVPVRYILTTNAPQEFFHTSLNESLKTTTERFLGDTEIIESNDTLQFEDYSIYDAKMFDPDAKKKRREEVFPKDLQKAYEAGCKLAVIRS